VLELSYDVHSGHMAYIVLLSILIEGSSSVALFKVSSFSGAYDVFMAPLKLSRITFKILLLPYKALIGDAPSYLEELVVPYCPTRELRSLTAGLLVVPRADMGKLRPAGHIRPVRLFNPARRTCPNRDFVYFRCALARKVLVTQNPSP